MKIASLSHPHSAFFICKWVFPSPLAYLQQSGPSVIKERQIQYKGIENNKVISASNSARQCFLGSFSLCPEPCGEIDGLNQHRIEWETWASLSHSKDPAAILYWIGCLHTEPEGHLVLYLLFPFTEALDKIFSMAWFFTYLQLWEEAHLLRRDTSMGAHLRIRESQMSLTWFSPASIKETKTKLRNWILNSLRSWKERNAWKT